MTGVSARMKETPESSLAVFPLWENIRRSWQSATGREFSLEPDHAGPLILDFQPPEGGEMNVCCFLATQLLC